MMFGSSGAKTLCASFCGRKWRNRPRSGGGVGQNPVGLPRLLSTLVQAVWIHTCICGAGPLRSADQASGQSAQWLADFSALTNFSDCFFWCRLCNIGELGSSLGVFMFVMSESANCRAGRNLTHEPEPLLDLLL
jgi:hypothetical protein